MLETNSVSGVANSLAQYEIFASTGTQTQPPRTNPTPTPTVSASPNRAAAGLGASEFERGLAEFRQSPNNDNSGFGSFFNDPLSSSTPSSSHQPSQTPTSTPSSTKSLSSWDAGFTSTPAPGTTSGGGKDIMALFNTPPMGVNMARTTSLPAPSGYGGGNNIVIAIIIT